MLTEGCTCPVSGPCLSVNHEALVLAAARHTRKLWFDDLAPIRLLAGLEYWYYRSYEFVSRFNFLPTFLFSFQSKTQLIATSNIKRKGFTCYFRTDHTWEPEIVKRTQPLEPDGNWIMRDNSMVFSKKVYARLTPEMMTNTGFTSTPLGGDAPPASERAKAKPRGKYYSVGISGGGWRALAGHTGVFRALSKKNALRLVDMFSSVSGGTWFLMKVAFDKIFSQDVLHSAKHIGEVVMNWMESKYYPVIRSTTTCSRQASEHKTNSGNTVGSAISSLILQAPGLVRSALGVAIVAANRFDFSWQNLVEQGVIGEDVASQPLTNVLLAPEARNKFGEATLAFNWNQLNHWDDTDQSTCSKWFLRSQAGDQYVQYPVYASALYKQVNDTDVNFKVEMQGRPIEGLFDICQAKKDDFCLQTAPSGVLGLGSMWRSGTQPATPSNCTNFNLESLTVGQVASASSAAAGGGAVQTWVQNVIDLVRENTRAIPMRCMVLPVLLEQFVTPCNRDIVVKQAMNVLGCKSSDGGKMESNKIDAEHSARIAKQWSAFLQKMAILMTVDTPMGKHAGHMAIDAVRSTPCGDVNRQRHSIDTDAMHQLCTCHIS